MYVININAHSISQAAVSQISIDRSLWYQSFHSLHHIHDPSRTSIAIDPAKNTPSFSKAYNLPCISYFSNRFPFPSQCSAPESAGDTHSRSWVRYSSSSVEKSGAEGAKNEDFFLPVPVYHCRRYSAIVRPVRFRAVQQSEVLAEDLDDQRRRGRSFGWLNQINWLVVGRDEMLILLRISVSVGVRAKDFYPWAHIIETEVEINHSCDG